mmetsp:Transcript_13800/g.35461  ORF Transcript_13800/g.35461 Transcript_13800/m.35461 type:complete len:205 (-) Transcript_13800:14-628(-)
MGPPRRRAASVLPTLRPRRRNRRCCGGDCRGGLGSSILGRLALRAAAAAVTGLSRWRGVTLATEQVERRWTRWPRGFCRGTNCNSAGGACHRRTNCQGQGSGMGLGGRSIDGHRSRLRAVAELGPLGSRRFWLLRFACCEGLEVFRYGGGSLGGCRGLVIITLALRRREIVKQAHAGHAHRWGGCRRRRHGGLPANRRWDGRNR